MCGAKFARMRAEKEDFSAPGKTFALRAPGLFAKQPACIWSFTD
jgi:hypothetical protein